jgi:hypothetical protein
MHTPPGRYSQRKRFRRSSEHVGAVGHDLRGTILVVHPGGKASIAKDQLGEGYGEVVELIRRRCGSPAPR